MSIADVEAQERQRYYAHLHSMGLRPDSHVPVSSQTGGINMGKGKKGKKEETTATPVAPETATPETPAPVEKPEEAVAEMLKTAGKIVTPTDEQVLAWMKEQGDKPITSTMIRDNFKLKNRAAARRIMKHLAADGKVKKTEKSNGEEGEESASSEHKRKQFVYKLV